MKEKRERKTQRDTERERESKLGTWDSFHVTHMGGSDQIPKPLSDVCWSGQEEGDFVRSRAKKQAQVLCCAQSRACKTVPNWLY